MDIRVDDLRGPEIIQLLSEHMQHMARITPRHSVHALDVNNLRHPDITLWTAWDESTLLGCGALKQVTLDTGEIKSMRTAADHLRKGVAAALMQHMLDEAKRRSYAQLFLETGASDAFIPAHRLYARFGFTRCGPFTGYVEDPNSVFMTRAVG